MFEFFRVNMLYSDQKQEFERSCAVRRDELSHLRQTPCRSTDDHHIAPSNTLDRPRRDIDVRVTGRIKCTGVYS
jgi:hypothetical protein